MKKNLYLVFSLFLIFFLIGIKIHAQCDPPLAVGDFAVTLQGNAVVIPVQKNDTTTIFGQPVIRPLLTQILTVPSPSVATISVLNNDSILFIPQGSFTGTATFTYRVCNQCGCSNSATVVVLVSSYCGPPLLKRDEFFVYNNFNNKLNVLENDSFPIKIPYTITFSQPSSGNISLSGNQLIYFNSGNNTGVDSFSYTVCYNRSSNDTCPSCDTATVVLNIVGNCVSPVAADDQLQTLQGKRDTISVLQNDDLNNFVLTGFSIIKLPANGSSSIFNNRIIYQSNTSFVGLDTILYNVCTTCGCDTGQLIVSVAPVACQKPKAVLDVAPTGYSSSCPFTYQVIQNDINGLNCLPLKLTKIIQQPFKGTAVADTAAGNIIYSGPGLFLDTFVYIKYEV
ncbi:MAG: Ig-like domain-containing protein, partial [Chitinophagales bacterium]|nr:Ig-like domain-containing protein [Chitinophagales bacterium]